MGEEERGEMAIVGGEGKSPSTSNEQALWKKREMCN